MSFLLTQTIGGSQNYKDAVRAASSANVPLSGVAPIIVGGVTLADGNRVLLKNQANATQNGIYVIDIVGGTYTLARSADCNSSREIPPNMLVAVNEGTFQEQIFQLITDGPIVLGSTALTFDYAVIYSHSLLTNLGSDDHTQYHTDGRALTWLGTRSTADLPENVNYLYFTDTRAQNAVVTQVITNGITNKAPSENAVFDALDLKVNAPVGATTFFIPVFSDGTGKTLIGNSGWKISGGYLTPGVDGAGNIGGAGLTPKPAGIWAKTSINLEALTGTRVLVSDSNKNITSSNITTTELGYLSGISGAVQTQLDDKEKKGYYTRVAKSANYAIATTDDYIGCNSTGGTFTVTLPAANLVQSGKRYIIKDEGGAATTNNISIAVTGSDTIDGQASESLVVNYESITLVCDGASKWFIV
jgi:hypothetical protein